MKNPPNTMAADFFNCCITFACHEFIDFKTNVTGKTIRRHSFNSLFHSLTSGFDKILDFGWHAADDKGSRGVAEKTFHLGGDINIDNIAVFELVAPGHAVTDDLIDRSTAGLWIAMIT